MTEEQLNLIDRLNPLNIEARYPTYKERLMRGLSKADCKNVDTPNNRIATMDIMQALIVANKYKEEVSKQMKVKAVYLFGSYSNGTNSDESDIDIAVVVEHLSNNYFEDTPLLWKIGRKVSTLIEPILLSKEVNNPMYQTVMKTGILV